jgi:hypothetical protein
MPKEREYEKRIPKFLRRKTMDMFMYGYVCGVIDHMPAVPIRRAIESFLVKHNISEDDFSLDSAVQVYYKMRDDFQEFIK